MGGFCNLGVLYGGKKAIPNLSTMVGGLGGLLERFTGGHYRFAITQDIKVTVLPAVGTDFARGYMGEGYQGTKMIPSTGIPKRIGAIYSRRPTTAWSEKEIRAYKQIAKGSNPHLEQEVELIERYYLSERKKGEKGIYRRDLLTLLNNWNGELDRAREWSARTQKPKVFTERKKEIGTASDEDYKRVSEIAKREIERLRAKLSPVPEV